LTSEASGLNLLAVTEHVGGLLASAARLEIMLRFHRQTAKSIPIGAFYQRFGTLPRAAMYVSVL
jgi:hypothetical protein